MTLAPFPKEISGWTANRIQATCRNSKAPYTSTVPANKSLYLPHRLGCFTAVFVTQNCFGKKKSCIIHLPFFVELWWIMHIWSSRSFGCPGEVHAASAACLCPWWSPGKRIGKGWTMLDEKKGIQVPQVRCHGFLCSWQESSMSEEDSVRFNDCAVWRPSLGKVARTTFADDVLIHDMLVICRFASDCKIVSPFGTLFIRRPSAHMFSQFHDTESHQHAQHAIRVTRGILAS